MSLPAPEKVIRCLACEKLYPVSQIRAHQRKCPEMVRLDREISERGRNLLK
jgi:phage FluMu protein Com